MKTTNDLIADAITSLRAEERTLDSQLSGVRKILSTVAELNGESHRGRFRKNSARNHSAPRLSKTGREAIAKAARKRWATWRKAKAAKR